MWAGEISESGLFTMMTSKEIILFTRVQEEDLRVFFRRFLIVHLAPNPDMDDYSGFTYPEALVLSDE
jgi:hypothetical protein